MSLRRLWADPSIRTAIVVFAVARVTLSGMGLLLWSLGLVPTTPDPVARPYFGVEPVVTGWRGALLGVWQRFDVIHYQRIAAHGYMSPDLAAFPPLFPLAARLAAWPLGGDTLSGGWLVANVCTFALFVALYRLADSDFGNDVARRSVIYLAFFPTSFFLMAGYSEALFLCLAVASFAAARRGRFWLAGLAGAGCALTRLNGVFTCLPLAYEIWRRHGWRPDQASRWLAAVLPPIGLGWFLLWGAWTHLPTLWTLQSTYWERITLWPWTGVLATIQRLMTGTAVSPEWLDLLIVLLMLAGGVWVWQCMPRAYGIWMWSVLVFNLMQVRIPQPLSGQARFALALFPAFIALADWARTSWRNRLVLYPSAALWLYCAGQFALWGWVG